MNYKALVASLGAVFLAGCATTNEFVVVDYNTILEEKLPPISVYYQNPTDELNQFCDAYDSQSVLHDCATNIIDLENFYNEFNQSNLFERVYYAEQDVDFKVLISTANYSHSSGVDIGKAALAGATLLLAPITSDQDIKIDVAVTWKDHLIHRFQSDIPFTTNANLFTADQKPEADMAQSISSYLMKDFQENSVFTPEFLSKEIQSSNYALELNLPEFMGEYELSENKIFHNPLNGVINRYTHEEFQFDYVDIFVYPVRHWQLDNHQALMDREIDIIKKEIDLLLKESDSSNALYSEPEFYSIDVSGKELSLAFLSGNYFSKDNQSYQTVIYLYRVKDKFVKFRSTFEAGVNLNDKIKDFVDSIAREITVPEESLFMAQIRQSWRASALQPL